MAMQSLLILPLEIILRILSLLDGRQIARCSAACAYLKDAIDNSTAMRYAIMLAICGYKDRPYCDGYDGSLSTVATRLNQLKRHIGAWNNLDWVESFVKIPSPRFDALSGGVLVNVARSTVTCVQLPSLLRDIPLRTWTLENSVDVDCIGCIAVDASQDLFVIFYQQNFRHSFLRLQSLSDSKPHPQAALPVLEVWMTFMPITQQSQCMIQITGHLLGILHYFDIGMLQIWDWTTGHRVTYLELTPDYRRSPGHVPFLPFTTLSFTFLSGTSFMVPSLAALDVYQFSPGGRDARPVHIASFGLPPVFLEPETFAWIVVNASALQEACSSFDDNDRDIPSASSRLPPCGPLGTVDDCHYIELRQHTRNNDDARLVHFYIPLHLLCQSVVHENPLAIPWDVWSQGVYIDQLEFNQFDYLMKPRLLHSGRVVGVAYRLSDHRATNISLLDFNQKRAQLCCADASSSRIHDVVYGNAPIRVSLSRDGQITAGPPLMRVASRDCTVGGPDAGDMALKWTGSFLDNEHIIIKQCFFENEEEVDLTILTM